MLNCAGRRDVSRSDSPLEDRWQVIHRRESRAPLDRERLVREALALLDEVGLDDLSMRRLADRLGVTAASLYWYVRDKDELMARLADAISGEMPLPDPGLPWREALEEGARNLRRVALSHRDAARILAATMPAGPYRLRMIDALLGLLLRAGFAPEDVVDLSYLFNAYVVGFMLDQDLGSQSAPPNLTAARCFVRLAGACAPDF